MKRSIIRQAGFPRGQSNAVVRSFMAHHQGMSLLSLAYLLLDKPMQKRFESEAQFKAIMLLLQERIPHATEFYSPSIHVSDSPAETSEVQVRVLHTPHTPVPELQLLSNGRYHVMVTNSGAGYSRWKDIAVTRWREDGTCDDWGTFCYIRDMDSGNAWSSAFQPCWTRVKTMKLFSRRGGPNSADAITISKPIRKSLCLLKMMWKCAGFISPTDRGRKDISK